jgi:hypothetical protein
LILIPKSTAHPQLFIRTLKICITVYFGIMLHICRVLQIMKQYAYSAVLLCLSLSRTVRNCWYFYIFCGVPIKNLFQEQKISTLKLRKVLAVLCTASSNRLNIETFNFINEKNYPSVYFGVNIVVVRAKNGCF